MIYPKKCHSCARRNPENNHKWIPAFAGMTVTFVSLIFCLFASAVSAQTPLPNLQKPALKEYQKTLEQIDKTRQKDIIKLKYTIKSKYVNDAVKLSRTRDLIDKKQFDSALSLLKKIKKSSPLSPYAALYTSQALVAKKKYEKALDALPALTDPVTKIEWDLFWQRLNVLALSKQKNTLPALLEPVQKKYKKDKNIALKTNYYLGLAEHIAKNEGTAFDHLRKVVVGLPGTEFDQKIFALLSLKKIEANKFLSTTQWNERAKNLAATGYTIEALEIWKALAQNSAPHSDYLAQAYYKARIYDQAAQQYENLFAQNPSLKSNAAYWDKLAHSYLRQNQFTKAHDAFLHIATNFSQTREAGIARFKLGFIYFDSGQYAKAIDYFAKFMDQGSSWMKNRAHWFTFWSHYLLKDYPLALTDIEKMLSLQKKMTDTKMSLLYWKARLLEKTSQTDQAKGLYQEVSRLDSLGYYPLMARQRLQQQNLHPKTLIDPKLLAHIPKTTTAQVFDAQKIVKPPRTDPLLKALLLYHLGFENYAFDESRNSELIKDITDYQTAKTVELAGNFSRGYSMRFLAAKGNLAGANEAQGFQLSYPVAYPHYVVPFSKIWNLDQNLVLAMMRQESAFKPEAFSFAFANGLMQIIPPTGKEIADAIGFEEFHPDLLREPGISVFFGTYYIRHLLDTFDNNMIFAIAAYNAGPDALKRWTQTSGSLELDEFIELIPYIETGNYVKKVLVNYLVYQRLY